MDLKQDSSVPTLADIDQVKIAIQSELADIRRVAPMVVDGSKANDSAAIQEIAQSIGAIAAQLGIILAAFTYVLRAFEVL